MLAVNLAVRHFVHQRGEFLFRELSTHTAYPTRDVVPNYISSRAFNAARGFSIPFLV
jgi:hypothetical protein